MTKFKEMIKLDSLTQAERIVKTAMKSQDMHRKAIDIITSAMDKIMNQENNENSIRETNVDTFLAEMNKELMMEDPEIAMQLGIKTDLNNN